MKKLMKVLCVLGLVMLTGCSDAYTNVSDASTPLFTVNGNSVTKGEIYPMLMYYSGVETTLDMVLEHIMDKEVPMTEEAIAVAKADFEEMKSAYGDSFSFIVSYYGYESEEEFYEEVYLNQHQNTLLVSKYVDSKFDVLSVTHKPRKVEIMEFDNKETAEKAYSRVFTDKEAFTTVAKELATTTFDGSEMIITASSSLDSKLLGYLTGTTVSKKIEEIVEGSNGKFYVANVVEGDPANFRQEACDAIAASSTVSDEATRYFLQQYDFQVSDKSLHNLYKDDYADYLFD